MEEANKMWETCKQALLAQVGRIAYDYWNIEETYVIIHANNRLHVIARDQYAALWLTRLVMVALRALADTDIVGIYFYPERKHNAS